MVVRDLTLGAARTPSGVAAPARFNLIGLHWQGSGSVRFRTHSLSGAWSGWRAAAPEAEDAPNRRSTERARTRGWRLGNPYWTGPSDRIDVRVPGRVRRLRGYFIWSPVASAPPRSTAIAGSPPLVTRAQWNADESIRRGAPWYAPAVSFAVVHHTAGSNSYGPAESGAIVRGIELYHVRGNGWNDIGYNFLVDRYGQVFEGRYGGVDRNVVGAHAAGFNYGSTGAAVIGRYDSSPISAVAKSALVKLLAWRLDVAHVDPRSKLTWTSNGNPRYPAGREVSLRAVSGHRDTGPTSCPGSALYSQLPGIATAVAATGLPKLYSPVVVGSVGGPVRVTATLSTPLSWTVTVTDGLGRAVASGAGRGTTVDWTWDATSALRGRYTYTIQAGTSVRPASGSIGTGAPVVFPVLSGARAEPMLLAPGNAGQPSATTVRYRLSAPATVSATLLEFDGGPIATLIAAEPRQPGEQSFLFDASVVPDGTFGVLLSARTADGKEFHATVPLRLDRAGIGLGADRRLFSPNGDGRLDFIHLSYTMPWPGNALLDLIRSGIPVGSLFSGTVSPGPQTLVWDGLVAGTRALDGAYRVLLTVSGPTTITHAETLRVDTTPPRLRLVTRRPLRLRVSEASTLELIVNGKRARRTVHAGVVRHAVRGRLRTLRAVARDAAGNASPPVRLG
jgi:N-acetylmuramoyl-L-alanine amidase-like protein